MAGVEGGNHRKDKLSTGAMKDSPAEGGDRRLHGQRREKFLGL